jgi:hypothetical protein
MDPTDLFDIDSAWAFKVITLILIIDLILHLNLPKNGAFWAQLSGFPYWPARYCSEWELRQLIRTTPENKLEWAKAKRATPVYFLKTLELYVVERGTRRTINILLSL